MNELPKLLQVIRQWIERAEHDLKTAQHTLTLEKDCPFDTICFHAQQCAEKYIKALLIFRNVDFPKTHDLTELAVLLPLDCQSKIVTAGIEELNPYAVEARYPGEWELPDREEAVRAVQLAQNIREIVRGYLPAEIFSR